MRGVAVSSEDHTGALRGVFMAWRGVDPSHQTVIGACRGWCVSGNWHPHGALFYQLYRSETFDGRRPSTATDRHERTCSRGGIVLACLGE